MPAIPPSRSDRRTPPRPPGATRPSVRGAAPLLLVLTLAGLAACGGARAGTGAEGGAAEVAEPEGAVFVVDSRLVGPVSVYATTGVSRVRLGTINVSQEATWAVPSEMVGRGRTVRLVLDQVGGPSVATEQFAIEAGDVVFLTVTEQIFQSGATLRIQMGG